MYDKLVKRLGERAGAFDYDGRPDIACDYEQAAGAIMELSDKLAIAEEDKIKMFCQIPRWIPVTEQLIHSGWYLVACNEWGGSAVRKAIHDEATRKWLEFPCGGPKDITKFVTHYMPLPEPPKEE